MKFAVSAGLAILLGAIIVVTSWHGVHEGRPTVGELQKSVSMLASEEGEPIPSVIRCQAKKLEESKLSDSALWALIDGEDSKYEPTRAEEKLLAEGGTLWSALQKCKANV